MHPPKTHELRMSFSDVGQRRAAQIKEDVKAWLLSNDVNEFVEGLLEGIDIDHEENYEGRDFYVELGGNSSPISIFKYSIETLEDLRSRLSGIFREGVNFSMHTMDTTVWLEGWKESFKPFATERFWIYPPWDKTPAPSGLIPLLIEPGMAFGTGQHATTQVCIRQLEKVASKMGPAFGKARMIDVGAGTGILSIAALKLGVGHVIGTDIDADAVRACEENARLNNLSFKALQMSVPVEAKLDAPDSPPYDLVVVNILIVVLEKIIGDLAKVLKPGGTMVMSGLLVEDEGFMTKLARSEGLKLVERSDLGGWACLQFTK